MRVRQSAQRLDLGLAVGFARPRVTTLLKPKCGIASLLLFVCAAATVNAQVPFSDPSVLRPVRRSTVTIRVVKRDGSSSGSGVVVCANGIVLTAAHVIRDAQSAKVVLPSGNSFPVAGAL